MIFIINIKTLRFKKLIQVFNLRKFRGNYFFQGQGRLGNLFGLGLKEKLGKFKGLVRITGRLEFFLFQENQLTWGIG